MDSRLKRLLFRARHMGTNENDVLFGTFAERNLPGFTPDQLDQFETLLAETDPDLFNWIAGRVPVPERHNHGVMKLLQSFCVATKTP